MVTNWRKVLDAVVVNAGWQPGEIRSKKFRHTFCATALQLLDGDEPISAYTVARWMGHGQSTGRTSTPLFWGSVSGHCGARGRESAPFTTLFQAPRGSTA